MKTDVQVIDDAIKLIEGDGKWCQGADCKDIQGRPTDPSAGGFFVNRMDGAELSPPHSFCLEGAIQQASGYYDVIVNPAIIQGDSFGELAQQTTKLCCSLAGFLRVQRPAEFNDDKKTTQEDAILALKRFRESL